MTAQVCDVNKALLSVSKMVKAGNRVIFDPEGSYIEDKNTGECMNLKEKNGMYMLSLCSKRVFRGKAAQKVPDPAVGRNKHQGH